MRRIASIAVAALSLISLLVTAAVADAPETGVVNGVVTDAGGSPLPGVSVMLIGERGEKATVTGDDGRYQFVLVQPGGYKVSASLEGMGTAEGSATVNAGGRETVDLELKLETAEEITVTSEAPMVDKFNVTAGATVQAEIGTQTAGTTRSFYGLLSALPGVASDAENADIQGTRPSVNGSHFADQYVFVDGVDATWGKYGGSRLFIPTTSVTEVAMEAGGSSAEYGRSIGSSTNVIVKSGTNQFHGAALVQRQEVDWGSDYKDQPILEERQFVPFPRDWLKLDDLEKDAKSTGYEASFGGPFKKDKAWFFIAWSDFDDNATEKLLGGDPQDASFQMESQVAKLNFQPSAAHTVTASYMDTPSKRVYSHPPSFDYWTPTPHDISSDLASLTWNWSISSNLFLEAKLAAQESTEHKLLNCGSVDVATCLAKKQQDRGPDGVGDLRFPANPAAGPHWPGNNYGVYLDQGFVGAWHNGWILDDGFGNNVFPRDQANASFSQFAGAGHEIKYGLDYQDTKWEGEQSRTSLYSGIGFDALNPYGYRNAGITATACSFALGTACLFRDYNAEFLTSDRGSGDSEVENLAAFVRDRFTVGDHWTFNLGFRAETQKGLNDVRRTVFEDDYVSPRASASYDVHGNGGMLFSLNVGRYHALLNQAWIYQRLDDQWQGTRGFRDWLFCSPTDIALGNGALFNNPLFAQCREKGIGYNVLFRDFADVTIWELVDQGYFDSNITPYYKDEAILGFEWQFAGNWALDAKAIYWELGDMIGSTVQLGPRGEQFELAANYKDYPEIIAKLEAARRANGLPQAVSQETLDNFEEGVKEYQALQLQVNRRFQGGWALYNNLTWSETETTGSGAWWNNTNSEYGEELHVTLTPAMITACQNNQAARSHPVDCVGKLTPFLGQAVSTINRLGKDNNTDRPIIFNSFGFKRFDLGHHDLTVGGHFSFQSGLPWVREESVPIPLTGATGGNAASDSVLLMIDPFAAGGRRTPDIYTLNLSTAWGFPLGWKNLRGELRVESINVTNQQELQLLEFGRLSGRPGEAGLGDAYPTRRAFQRPRQVRANLTVRF
jgi:hypothetical protein